MTTEGDESTRQHMAICREHAGREAPLLPILHDMQARFGYVSEAGIRAAADYLNLSRAEVYGVVSFYHDFRRTPGGQSVVKICRAEACQAVGGREVWAAARKVASGVEHAVDIQGVYCLGNCACAPAIQINGKTAGRQSPESVAFTLARLAEGAL